MWPLRHDVAVPEDDDATWPGGGQVAVWVAVNIEHFAFGRPGPSIQPHLVHGHDIANLAWRDYGNRVGVRRLLGLLTELDVPVTAAMNSDVVIRYPDLTAELARAGWSIMGHGVDNSLRHHDLDPAAEHERVRAALGVLHEATGEPVAGWLTPGFAVSEHTHAILRENGVAYVADWCDDDRPYRFGTAAGELWAMPYSLETNDISLLLSMRYTAPQFAEAVVDHVAGLAAEKGQGRRVVGIGLHPFLVGQPGRTGHLRTCLETIARIPGVWLATADRIHEELLREVEG
jgi:allantoinase